MSAASVELLEQNTQKKWTERTSTVSQLYDTNSKRTGNAVVFLSSKDSAPSLEPLFASALGVPPLLWSNLHQEASGFLWASENLDSNGVLESYSTLSRFLIKHPEKADKPSGPGQDDSIRYDWYGMAFFTRWQPDKGSILLCFDVPPAVRDEMKHALLQDSPDFPRGSPFGPHVFFLDHVVRSFDVSVWAWRDKIRKVETMRAGGIHQPRPEYVNMHELARHAIHSSEMLSTASNGVDAILDEHLHRSPVTQGSRTSREVTRAFKHYHTLLQCIHNRSKALESRLKNEMNLAFHVNAQHDSKLSADIARAAQIDSAAMRTISVLGLVFLPGTFISAIFSMSFFNFQPATDGSPQSWRVSNKFWIYWVVAAPVTIVTIAFWHYWQKKEIETTKVPKTKVAAEKAPEPVVPRSGTMTWKESMLRRSRTVSLGPPGA